MQTHFNFKPPKRGLSPSSRLKRINLCLTENLGDFSIKCRNDYCADLSGNYYKYSFKKRCHLAQCPKCSRIRVYHQFMSYAENLRKFRHPTFWSLTYPRWVDDKPDTIKETKRLMDNAWKLVIQTLKRQKLWNSPSYIKVLEILPRPGKKVFMHFHVVINQYLPVVPVRSAWSKSLDYPNTWIHASYVKKDIIKYVLKYLRKNAYYYGIQSFTASGIQKNSHPKARFRCPRCDIPLKVDYDKNAPIQM